MKERIRAWKLGTLAAGTEVLLAVATPAFALQEDNRLAAVMAFAGAFLVLFLFIGLVAYVYVGICLQTIAKKTNTANGWLAWIPIGNLVLMINIAKRPLWWLVFFLVPAAGPLFTLFMGKLWFVILIPLLIVEIVVTVILWRAIAKARNKPEWWGILIIVPLVNLIVPGYLAFATDATGTVPQGTDFGGLQSGGQGTDFGAGASSLYCVSGEFANDGIEIPPDGLYIGRDPSKSNLVLSSPEISSVHAYVRPEGESQIALEDWNSLNGTYYRSDALSQWVQLKGRVVLSRGARFRLSDNTIEFEIRA